MNWILSIALLLLCCASAQAATYYVRSDGGTTTQCLGTTNAAYDGAGTGEACAYAGLQDAINAATFGDTIKILAGDTVSTQVDYAFGEFQLTNKGTPPTGTDADYITITTTDPSGTPAALSGYPATRTRITTAMAANMPKVVAEGSTPLFRVNNSAKYWKIERLNITNDSSNGWQTVVFVNNDDPGPTTLASVPHHIVFQYNWIHPEEEVGTALTSTNDDRSAENAMYLNATDVTIQYNAIQGFVGRARYGGNVGSRFAAAGYLVTNYADSVLVQNNLIEAWTYAFFAGGSSMADWTVTEGGTITSCSSTTVCTFSDVVNLAVGDPVAVYITSAATWGAAFVTDITSNQVTFGAPLCHSYDGNNSCTGIPGDPTPANGDPIRWDGIQPENMLFKQNIFAHYPEWAPLMDGDCGGKGYLEVKSCVNCVFNGNVFTGCTGPTITVRNQGADFVWSSLDGLTFSNNLWEDSNRPFTLFLRDSSPTPKSQDVSFTNNLYLGVQGNTEFIFGGEFSANTGGGVNVTIQHNTVAWSKTYYSMPLTGWKNFTAFLLNNSYDNTIENFVIKDNILPVGTNICWNDGGAGSSHPMDTCWPDATITNNVFVNADGHTTGDINNWWLTIWPNNSLVTNYGPVGFRNPNSTMTIGGDYRLLPSSTYHNAASDGTDIGYNHTALVTALGFDPLAQTTTRGPHGKVTIMGKGKIR